MTDLDSDELLDLIAQQCVALGIEFTNEHMEFIRELLHVISLQQQLAQRMGEPAPDFLDLLRAWNDRFERVAADDPADLLECLKNLAETIEIADSADDSPRLCPQVREQVAALRAEALEMLDHCKAEIRAMTAHRLSRK